MVKKKILEPKYTWVNTYKCISEWILTKQEQQVLIINLLKRVGIDGFKDRNENNEEFELNEIDPFSFFAYLNKYKIDSKRIEILQKIHSELKFQCEKPQDVIGIPTTHPLKVRLFPFKYLRLNNEINDLWELFSQVVQKGIDDILFQKVLKIKNVGNGKLSIAFFYSLPDYYLSLDSISVMYLRLRLSKQKINYRFNHIDEYLSITEIVKEKLKRKPYEISSDAWLQRYNINQPLLSIDEQEVKIIENVGTLMNILEELFDASEDKSVPIYYRGHSSITHKLEPSIYRNDDWIRKENKLFKDIIARSPNDFIDCNSTFEKLVKMQHYSLPTRLLDITSNPLVALYFACKNTNSKEIDNDGILYRFVIPEDEIRYYDSDTISIVANIARRPFDFSIKEIKHLERDDFNKEEEIQYLLHEIRSEKSHFSPVINSKDLESVFCVKPKLDNPRIIRQEGAFFIFGITNDKMNCAKFVHNSDDYYLIRKENKKIILRQLDALGINESTLFPEIEHVAKDLKEKTNVIK
jgi:hypothetical protein